MVEESMFDVNESVTETKVEDIKYALNNKKYKFYVRYGEYLVRYLMSNMYIVVEILLLREDLYILFSGFR